ncbi:sensor domain-containing diguanylate cyclase [Amphritea japonica]|uniref:Signal transduction protein n=1 Tax=Amphritea japonica ATCC BAA-1530 TaxID=1278309 RepID=A0A7R6PN11_9GAMM|nr:sensor domain-containing diguanylate cyclase [Amphritea japonica]BBB26368.1 signal transduction protein [Amphritea japonica ATCC BAA-1530]
MKKPDKPIDEVSRINTLRSLQILDTPTEERFDRLTRLAARMFDVPIALVSLVDEQRQWFKSATGLDATETHRDISFCGHAILEDEVLNIPDATQDKRFSDNPLVTQDPRIRLYVGCPLKALNGAKMGTLCLIDQRPRTLSEEDLQALKDLAHMAEQELAASQLATLDDLTMISNRRGFTLLAEKALQMSARNGLPASLIAIDLNKFKQINDHFGHAEGDKTLIAFTDILKNTFRESDLFARMGGDEFSVLLTNTTEEQAQNSLLRLRYQVNDFNETSSLKYQLEFSAGILPVDFSKEYDLSRLLEKSDLLMYKDKMTDQH